MKQILTTLLLFFSLTLSAQTTVVTGPKKKPQTTAPTKPKPAAPAAKPQTKPTPKTNSKPQPKQHTISAISGYENGYEWVNLGLSVKWATCNIGASSPTDSGSYFAWGETSMKNDYHWSTYFDTNDGGNTFLKYALNKKTSLALSDDAAHVNWGGSWRMPTKAELDELKKKCTWTWTTQNGVKGYRVSSKRNSNFIFLPAAGYRDWSSLYNVGSRGDYWSSSLCTGLSVSAFNLYFDSGQVAWFSSVRYGGHSVRAVCP